MAGVFSRRFLLKSSGGQSYTVPSGRKAVVKCVSGYSAGPGDGLFSLSIDGAPVLLGVVDYSRASAWTGLTIVVNAGETLTLNSPSPTTTQVSGYLLNDS